MKQSIVLSLMAVTTIATAGGIFWWLDSPLRAFEQTATAIKTHDTALFAKNVDEQSLIDSAMEDLVFLPVTETKWFTPIQHEAATTAVAVARGPVEKSLQKQLDAYVAGTPVAHTDSATLAAPGSSPPAESPSAATDASTGGTIDDVLHVAKKELRNETHRLKDIGYANMMNHAQSHPEALICQLIASDKVTRKSVIKERLEQYGLVASNFKGISSVQEANDVQNGGKNAMIDFKFQSPKVGHEVTVQAFLVRPPGGDWKITRVSNLRTLVAELEPSYDHDVQELASATMAGATPEMATQEIKGTAARIFNAPETKSFLKGIKSKLGKLGGLLD